MEMAVKTLVALERTKYGAFVFEHKGMSIHDPMSSECGRFRYEPLADGGHSPRVYGFEVEKTNEADWTAWVRVFEIGGERVVMRVTDETGMTHAVEPGAQIRIEVSKETGAAVALWYQDEGSLDDTEPLVVIEAAQAFADGKPAGSGLACPNCGATVVGHVDNGCALKVLMQALEERGAASEARLLELHAKCDASSLWDALGRVVDDIQAGKYLGER